MAAAALLLAASPAQAQHRGYYGGVYQHGFYAGYHGYYPPHYGIYHYGPVYYPRYVAPYWGYNLSYAPRYYVPSYYSYGYPALGYQALYPSTSSAALATAPTAPAGPDQVTQFEVRVPANAEVWFSGEKETEIGTVRILNSPLLPSGMVYFYDVRARWMEDGRVMDQTQRVVFHAGERVTVSFAGKAQSEVQTLPAPEKSSKP
jgi:uncharacterized protein (TIGR03000 family)